MYNQRPIFINSFSRGGSNILWNVFLSHPDVCSPIYETLEIFGAGITHATRRGYLIAILSGQPRLFYQWNLSPRRPVSPYVARLIDRTFYDHKLRTLTDPEMQYKLANERYTAEEVEQSRLVAKNNNGLAFLTNVLLGIYEDASFFGLVRHPLALYEGHRRRGLTHSVENFAKFYNSIAGRMLNDAERLKCYHLVRFEDLMKAPVAVAQRLFAQTDLDFSKIRKLRFKAKPHFQKNGQYGTTFQVGRHHWFDLGQVHQILDAEVNDYQISNIASEEKARLLELTKDVCQGLGYGAGTSTTSVSDNWSGAASPDQLPIGPVCRGEGNK